MIRRVAVIGDLHLGKTLYGYDLTPHIRRAMYEFLDLCIDSLAEAAVCLGDVFDRPTPPAVLQKTVVQWANEFERAGIDLYLLTGNHDVSSSSAAPSALESLRVVAPFKHVHVIDRPAVVRGVGTMLPFPSPGIFESHDYYTAAVDLLHHHEPLAFAHLNVDGAVVGDQSFPYRGDTHGLPAHRPWDLLVAGHIHKPQTLPSICVLGAAERTSFAERGDHRVFAVIERSETSSRLRRYIRPTALPLVQVQPDVSGWGNSGDVPTTEQVVADLERYADGAVLKVEPFIDERSIVDWPTVESKLIAAGAQAVFVAPSIRAQKAGRRVKHHTPAAPADAATRFIRERVSDKHERKHLLEEFKRIQKEVEHGPEDRS